MLTLPPLNDASLHLENRIAVLTFQRDDVRNALTGTHLVEDIVQTVEWVNANTGISVLIITGDGKAFSAGGNLKEMRDRTGIFGGSIDQIQQQYRQGIQKIPLALHSTEVPVIAAVNGPAIGAGMDLACMCDIRIGSENALFGETFINLGIIPGDGGAWFLQRLIGYQRAAELTFTGRVIKAEEAKSLGILLEITSPDLLLPSTKRLAETIAEKPPIALRQIKRLMKLAQRQELHDFLDSCAQAQAMCHNTEDHQEAVNAFLEKREGKYQGK